MDNFLFFWEINKIKGVFDTKVRKCFEILLKLREIGKRNEWFGEMFYCIFGFPMD